MQHHDGVGLPEQQFFGDNSRYLCEPHLPFVLRLVSQLVDWHLTRRFQQLDTARFVVLPKQQPHWDTLDPIQSLNSTDLFPSGIKSTSENVATQLCIVGCVVGNVLCSAKSNQRHVTTGVFELDEGDKLWVSDSLYLATLSLSFNNISGTTPSGTTSFGYAFPFLMMSLDVQNNSFLTGTVPSFAYLRFVTGCDTQLRGSLPANATLSCFPPGAIDLVTEAPDANKLAVAINLSSKYSYEFPETSTPTTTPAPPDSNTSNMPTPTPTANLVPMAPLSNALSTLSSATTTVMAITAATSSLFTLDAAEVQLLASILGSPCTCSATLADSDASLLHLAVSPFSPLAWAAIGNTLLSFAIAAVHVLIVNVVSRHRRASQRSQQEVRPSKFPVSSPLGRWLDGEPQRRQVASQCRFPNATVSLALLLLPGILRAVTGVGSQLMDGGGGEAALQGASMAIGIIGIMLIAACLECFVHRHIENEVNKRTFISLPRAESSSPHKNNASPLRFTSYKNVSKLFSHSSPCGRSSTTKGKLVAKSCPQVVRWSCVRVHGKVAPCVVRNAVVKHAGASVGFFLLLLSVTHFYAHTGLSSCLS